MPKNKVIIRIGNVYSNISGDLDDIVAMELYRRLAFQRTNALYQAKYFFNKTGKEWDGWTRLYFPRQQQSFYTGLMSEVTNLFKEANVVFEKEDLRKRPDQNLIDLKFIKTDDKQERDYQTQTVEACKKFTRGIIQAATGAGKTYIVTKLIAELKTAPFIFFVPSVDLLIQAHEELSKALNVPIGMAGDVFFDLKDITVMTNQTAIRSINFYNKKFKASLYKYDEEDMWGQKVDESKAKLISAYIAEAKCLYIDECHHAASKTCEDIAKASKNAYWRFGGSATPYREDGAELMIQALFGRKLVNISPSYLIERNFLVQPNIINVKINDDLPKAFSYANEYKSYIVENEKLNHLVASAMKILKDINVSTLVLVQRYEHGEILQKLVPGTPFIKGNMSGKKRKQIIKDLKSGEIKLCIATTLADEGLDVRRLGAILIPGGGKSITRVYQRVGRILRKFKDKDRVLAVLFQHTNSKYLKKHGARAFNLMKKEPMFRTKTCQEEELLDEIYKVFSKENKIKNNILG